jgi:hypothetical protein
MFNIRNFDFFKTHLLLFAIGLSGLFILSCANVVSPTGGPKDETPPKVIRSNPPNLSTNYDGGDVRIYFDEFVALENLRQNLLVSPPLNDDPEVKIRGKSIIMSVSDTLLEATTYNFFFGESVVDITEANAIPNFQFVVSTGDFVDSLSVVGVLRNAHTYLPEEGVFIMMYENIYDSIPYLERPVYLTKTNKEGEFQINNMREGDFLMFALKDLNSSFTFDDPTENIGFIDSLVTPYYIDPVQAISGDSIQTTDSLSNSSEKTTNNLLPEPEEPPGSNISIDSLALDSINDISKVTYPLFELFLFQEKDTLQRVVSAYRESAGKVNIALRVPADSIRVRDYENIFTENWFLPEYNQTRDTLTLWLPDIEVDTLKLEISDGMNVIDSATVSLLERTSRGRFVSEDEPEQTFVSISASALESRNVLPWYKPFTLRSQTPLASFQNELFQLFLNDTLPIDIDFGFQDEIKRNLEMNSLLEPDSSYYLFVSPGAITDIFGNRNDTITYQFKVNNFDDYGTLILVLDLPVDSVATQYVLQLLDESLEKVVQEKIITESNSYNFSHLSASKFKVRLILDENKNGIWDTGKFLERRQPEKVFIFNETIETRLNWDVEIHWDLSDK